MNTVGWTATDFERGLEAYEAGDFKKAYALWLLLAEEGVPEAQVNIAKMYRKGLFVSQDHYEANEWFLKAANQSNAAAQFDIGTAFHQGLGFEENLHDAARWYLKAAEQKHVRAQLNLGILNALGYGRAGRRLSDYAYMWLTFAEEAGSKEAIEAKDFVINTQMNWWDVKRASELVNECRARNLKAC